MAKSAEKKLEKAIEQMDQLLEKIQDKQGEIKELFDEFVMDNGSEEDSDYDQSDDLELDESEDLDEDIDYSDELDEDEDSDNDDLEDYEDGDSMDEDEDEVKPKKSRKKH